MKIQFKQHTNSLKPNKAIVAIHGWGGNKNSFSPFFKNLKINNVEWFCPEAPYNVEMDSKDKKNLLRKSWTYKKEDGSWEVVEPMNMMDDFFNEIIFQKFESKDVFVFGFSQGAAVCYEYILGIKKKLGGVFPIGGFLFKDSMTTNRVSEQNKNTPIIIGHGIKDDIVPIEKSKIAYSKLLDEGANVKFCDYNGGHKISMEFLRTMREVIDNG